MKINFYCTVRALDILENSNRSTMQNIYLSLFSDNTNFYPWKYRLNFNTRLYPYIIIMNGPEIVSPETRLWYIGYYDLDTGHGRNDLAEMSAWEVVDDAEIQRRS